MLDKTGKFLPGANTLAYLASPLAMKKKSFITLTRGASCCKTAFSLLHANKLECLHLATNFSLS
jgi:hypothetical protein